MNGISIILFLTPLLLHFGVAAQALGYYLFVLLIPLIYFSRTKNLSYVPIRTWALCLIGLYLLFPLTNVINLFLPIGETIKDVVSWPSSDASIYSKLKKSLSSSSFIVTSIVLFISYFLYRKNEIKVNQTDSTALKKSTTQIKSISFEKAEKVILYGFLMASVVLLGFVVNELFTGKLFRVRQSQNEFLLQYGNLYRVMGFSANPLHFSGIMLALFGSFWSWFWLEVQNYTKERKAVCTLLIVLSSIYLAMVLMSGGRTAIGTSAVILSFPLILRSRKSKLLLWVKLGYLGLISVAGVGLWKSGFLTRFMNSFENLLSGDLTDIRFKVWSLHWKIFKENPVFGQGYFELSYLDWRDEYYKIVFPEITEERRFSSHNQYLETLATSGLFGMIVTTLLLGLFLKSFYSFVKKEGQVKYFIVLVIMLLANFIHGFTENSLYTTTVTYAYFYIIGIFTTLVLLKRQNAYT